MYFPIGWPKILKTPETNLSRIVQVICNRDKILFVILTDDTISIWYCKPCVPIVFHRRCPDSVDKVGKNVFAEWKPDSSMLAVATSEGHLLLYNVGVKDDARGLYQQMDPPLASLRRDSAELFVKEVIPPLTLTMCMEVSPWRGRITRISCISGSDMMLSTERGHIVRYCWDGTAVGEYCLDLRRVPFCIDNQFTNAAPIQENSYVTDMEYSPLIGGFAIVLSDGRAAFLTALSLRFDPHQVQGIWAPDIDDATCASINHKYRLIAYGRKNSAAKVFTMDETSGGLEQSHVLCLGAKDCGRGGLGSVRALRWTPDGMAVAMTWQSGGLSLFSVFGALLMCSLGWDYGLIENTLNIISMDWSAEGYQLWMVRWQDSATDNNSQHAAQTSHATKTITSVVQLDFVKSSLTVNPSMSQPGHLYLQGDDRLYINLGENLFKKHAGVGQSTNENNAGPMLSESKNWLVVPIPTQYSSTNWPIRYTAIDSTGHNIAVAGRTGFALYLVLSRKWKLFGNESQEKDFVVTGGLLWWRDYIAMGCFSILENNDEIRMYPRDCKLDNRFAHVIRLPAQILVMNMLNDRLVVFCADSVVNIYNLTQIDAVGSVEVSRLQAVDISALCSHPACVVSVSLTRLRTESTFSRSTFHGFGERRGRYKQNTSEYPMHSPSMDFDPYASLSSSGDSSVSQGCSGSTAGGSTPSETMVLNISGRLFMVQREQSVSDEDCDDGSASGTTYTCSLPTVLASCVENVWAPLVTRSDKPHLTEALWLYCGAHGMRVWLPIFPSNRLSAPGPGPHRGDKLHTFMSKRIMLPFHPKIYPLSILFEDAIILGAENDTTLYTSDYNSPFSLPFCVLEKTSQVYLHQILRQLIRRNLGYHAYEIAVSCTNLPYFPHSLELLLHEVLEEEATSKEPLPDAQLPSVIEFIQEFPVYLQTVVQCARKTEIALWPYLFSAAGKPKELFKECLSRHQLETAASYLIILQNLEPSSVSRQFATLLLDTALEQCKWELSSDLVRFLRAIDPNDVESPRTSVFLPNKFGIGQQTPPVSPNAEELSLILGTMQVTRGRSYSTTLTPKVLSDGNTNSASQKQTIPNTSGQKQTIASPTNVESVQMRRKKSVPNTRLDRKDSATSSTAEQLFMDVLLQRHARRLLASQQLQALGQLSAALSFPLVCWLNRERERAARVDCFVSVLKRLHSEFEWPKPEISDRRGSARSQDSQQSVDTSLNSLKANMQNSSHNAHKSFGLDNGHSRVGDSGYMSYPGLITPVHSDDTFSPDHHTAPPPDTDFSSISYLPPLPLATISSSRVVEAVLAPHDDRSVGSEQVSVWADDISLQTPSGDFDNCYSTVLETLSNQVEIKGSPKAEVQLRYLLQIFTEAGCLEWSLLISILLRDAMAVLRTTNAARSSTQSTENVERLRDGLQHLCQWVYTECTGYKPFFLAIQNQVSMLTNLLGSKDVTQPRPDPMNYSSGISSIQNCIVEEQILDTASNTLQRERKSLDGSSNVSSLNHSLNKDKDISRKNSIKSNSIKLVQQDGALTEVRPHDNEGLGCILS